ncbi:glycosyltransferase [Aliarcobacter cryaerophilus]|uniref:glycosyltransferase n=1 Tax=Aliarcobacter cryaerophilus TaxID=28198 RepID=UPI0021B58374|nr:glycosyltransferase [Aliarcobacter cryaerophilus]MCT7520531.1 glycosyltransferase [Aliarcobacter cryaerophilus]
MIDNIICLDENYSTTRFVTQDKIQLQSNPEDKFETVLFLPKRENRIGEGGLRTKGYFKKSLNDKPLISIITVVFNGEKHLEETIRSVLSQSYDNIEYIVIDGGSIDGTLDIIKKYENKIDYWVSEKDQGIGDAWNKGINLSTGSIIGIINADDVYHRETIKNLVREFKDDDTLNSLNIYYGTTKFILNNEIVSINNKDFDPKKIIKGFGFTHVTCFVHKEVYKLIGLFNIDVKIAVDTDFLIRSYLRGINFKRINVITYMNLGGISDKYNLRAYDEYLYLLKKYKIINKKQKNKQFIKYRIYNLFRPIVKSLRIKNTLRQVKHIIIKSINIIYNNIPTFYLKNLLLKTINIHIGKYSYIHPNVKLYSWSNLIMCSNSVINSNCIIDNRNLIKIGKNVSIAHNTKIYTCGHDIYSPYFDIKCKNVTIEDYVCIFSNSIIMPGVVLKKGSVILPGSIITKDTQEYGIYGGNPAKLIGYREKNLLYKINYGFWGAM